MDDGQELAMQSNVTQLFSNQKAVVD
ncbi:hypothetical protein OOU_Y34scaffold00654g5 [Pyricularia oryzae Y34]|uniref:Uncharacterized protein n=2 Tax=Pyricularia oryzae TaxID=318829 RepID=A0AA97NUB2_PYRO3|nr:hypothetical protein OOU_Y34scaffold00654g5 [Pyricularia oryzae Y34]